MLIVIDSFGKPTSGILQGSMYWLGEYSECLNITEKSFQGKYCLLGKPTFPQAPESFVNKNY